MAVAASLQRLPAPPVAQRGGNASLTPLGLELGNAFLQLLHGSRERSNVLALAGIEAPAALGLICHRPDPQERPQRVQREQAYPARGVNSVLVRVVPVVRDLSRYVVDGDDSVEQHHADKYEDEQRDIFEHGGSSLGTRSGSLESCACGAIRRTPHNPRYRFGQLSPIDRRSLTTVRHTVSDCPPATA